MYTVLIVIQLLISLALIAVVLMQRTAQDGGGLMGGGSTMGGLFTARGSANLLTRTTAILATLFMGMSLLLGIIAAQRHNSEGMVDAIAPLVNVEDKAAQAPKDETPVVPSVPVSK